MKENQWYYMRFEPLNPLFHYSNITIFQSHDLVI
jgi:hypothetical protein